MTSTKTILTGLAALSAAACLSSAAFAQDASPGAPPSPAGMHERWAEHRREHAEERVRALHDILNIRPDQEAAFQTFVSSMKPDGDHMGPPERHDQADEASLTTPQRLDRMAARMAKHDEAFQKRAAAVRAFYAALSPEQQRAFDAMHALMGHGRRGGWGGHDHEGFGGPHGPDGPRD